MKIKYTKDDYYNRLNAGKEATLKVAVEQKVFAYADDTSNDHIEKLTQIVTTLANALIRHKFMTDEEIKEIIGFRFELEED